MISVGHVARIGERGSACRVRDCKPSRKRPAGRSRIRWEGIKQDLQEIERTGVDWIDPAQDKDQLHALVDTVTNFSVL
jgi:hypothetical protein